MGGRYVYGGEGRVARGRRLISEWKEGGERKEVAVRVRTVR